MPRRFLMSNLEARCRKRVSHPASDGPIESDGEDGWKSLISEQYGDLYSIVAESGMSYFEYTTDLVTTGAAYLDEPVDHLSTVGLDYIVNANTGERRPLEELMAQERARMSGQRGDARFYALIDDRIYLYPTPSAGKTYELLYIPQPPDLTTFADADVVDVVTPAGEAFLIWGVAVKAHGILESDAQLAILERDKAKTQLEEWAVLRAINSPRRRIVQDSGPAAPFVSPASWRYR